MYDHHPLCRARWLVSDAAIDFDTVYAEFDTALMCRRTFEVNVAQCE
jgi:hypothetical protein